MSLATVQLCWVASDSTIQPSYFPEFSPEHAAVYTDHRKGRAPNSVKHDHVQLICCSACAHRRKEPSVCQGNTVLCHSDCSESYTACAGVLGQVCGKQGVGLVSVSARHVRTLLSAPPATAERRSFLSAVPASFDGAGPVYAASPVPDPSAMSGFHS